MSLDLHIVCDEGQFTIYAIGDSLVKFLQEQKLRVPKETLKLLALLTNTAKQGPPQNIEKCRPLEAGLYEFKANSLRVIWFWDSNRLILCTHGFVKKRQKTPRLEIEQAKKSKALYESAKHSGRLTVKGKRA